MTQAMIAVVVLAIIGALTYLTVHVSPVMFGWALIGSIVGMFALVIYSLTTGGD